MCYATKIDSPLQPLIGCRILTSCYCIMLFTLYQVQMKRSMPICLTTAHWKVLEYFLPNVSSWNALLQWTSLRQLALVNQLTFSPLYQVQFCRCSWVYRVSVFRNTRPFLVMHVQRATSTLKRVATTTVYFSTFLPRMAQHRVPEYSKIGRRRTRCRRTSSLNWQKHSSLT